MLIRKPHYFDQFSCIADACPDSCCTLWDVQVDNASAAVYRSLPGALGDRLRAALSDEDGETYLTIENGRCPMWRTDGLCRIQCELGADALCKTCREFPRLTHDYGDFIEYGLELSCPEAARILLGSTPGAWITSHSGEPGEAGYDIQAMSLLLATRECADELLADTRFSVPEVLALLLLYGYRVQSALDGAPLSDFSATQALESARSFASPADTSDFLAFFDTLEILTPAWGDMLRAPVCGHWDDRYRALARYFIDRYYLQAVSDYDLIARVKFAVISCIAIRLIGGDLTRTAQLYSKEIENSAENVDALLDAAYTHPAFTDAHLLGALLG